MAEKEYIEREAVIEQIRLIYCGKCNSYNGVRCRACEFDDAMSLFEDAPAADVVEVRHGRYVYDETKFPIVKCSECGHTRNCEKENGWNFCSYCGAKMDGGKTE